METQWFFSWTLDEVFVADIDGCQFLVHSALALKPDWRGDFTLSQKGMRDFRCVVGTEDKSSWMDRSGFDAQRFHCFRVFTIHRILGGWMCDNTGSHCTGIDFRAPDIMRIVEFRMVSMRLAWQL